MYQVNIKSPAWEFERFTDKGNAMFSSRNSGCADFIAIPNNQAAFYIKVDAHIDELREG